MELACLSHARASAQPACTSPQPALRGGGASEAEAPRLLPLLPAQAAAAQEAAHSSLALASAMRRQLSLSLPPTPMSAEAGQPKCSTPASMSGPCHDGCGQAYPVPLQEAVRAGAAASPGLAPQQARERISSTPLHVHHERSSRAAAVPASAHCVWPPGHCGTSSPRPTATCAGSVPAQAACGWP